VLHTSLQFLWRFDSAVVCFRMSLLVLHGLGSARLEAPGLGSASEGSGSPKCQAVRNVISRGADTKDTDLYIGSIPSCNEIVINIPFP
jgi:hypothetical protein